MTRKIFIETFLAKNVNKKTRFHLKVEGNIDKFVIFLTAKAHSMKAGIKQARSRQLPAVLK